MKTAFVNGEYCNVQDAKISIFDRGFLFGDAVYEVLPVYHGQPYFVEQHIARLESNLEKAKIVLSDYDWHQLINTLITENGGGNMQIYLHVTRGNEGMRKHDIPSKIKPSIIAFTIHNRFPTLEEKETGFTAITVEDIRWTRCDIKTTSLLANILLNDEAVSSGYQTSLLIRDNFVTEGSSSNVFILTKDNVIQSPPLNNFCLPGITRQIAVELINNLNWQFIEKEIQVSELFEAQEVWITSTTKEICPITRIDDQFINNGVVGEYWRTINQSYQQLIS